MSLRPCVSCTRHVRSTESACPFCGSALPEAPVPVARNIAGLGRAAIMAFGTLAATEAGCAPVAMYGSPPVDAGRTDAAFIGGQDAAYGGPPVDAAGPDAFADQDAGGEVAAYGGPPFDAGGQVDSGGQADTGGGVGPLYGGAP